jgi:hypothetical protein
MKTKTSEHVLEGLPDFKVSGLWICEGVAFWEWP